MSQVATQNHPFADHCRRAAEHLAFGDPGKVDQVIQWLMNLHQETAKGAQQLPSTPFEGTDTDDHTVAERLDLLNRAITAFEASGRFQAAEVLQRQFDRLAAVQK